MPLLNYYSQTKMAKGEALGYKTAIMHFAPYDMSGKNVCPKATKGPGGCIVPCLNTSGRGQMNSVQQARINKTNYFWNNKNGFLWELSKEIQTLKVRAANAGFKFNDDQIKKFKSGSNQIELGIDHDEYSHSTKLNELTINSLISDFN